MRTFCALLFIVMGLGLGAQAQPVMDQAFAKYQSPFLEIIHPPATKDSAWRNRFPLLAKLLSVETLQYNPKTLDEHTNADCSSELWWQQNQDKHSFPELTTAISSYFKKCESQILTGWKDVISNLYFTMMVRLNPQEHPYGRFVLLHLPNGIQLKGFLGLKGDDKKRPLVILRLGIFSSASAFLPERFLFMQLFEQAPFNILLLESDMNREFILRNKTLALGGFDEGIQNFQVARQLQDPTEPLSKLIESVHLAGISMGGHGVLFASMLNSFVPTFRSSLVLCPLVNYQETFEKHLSTPLNSFLFNAWVADRMQGIEKVLPQINEDHFVRSMVEYMESDYHGPKTIQNNIPLPAMMRKNMSYFWEGNDFWPFYKNVQTPVLVLATQQDPIVDYALNSEKLAQHEMNIGKSNLRVITLHEGWHCSLPAAYQWKPIATLLQSYILQQSSYQPLRQTREMQLSMAEAMKLRELGHPPMYSVEAGSNDDEIVLHFQFAKGGKIWRLLDSGWVSRSLVLKKSDIGYGNAPFAPARWLYERWFAQNLHFQVLTDQGNPRLQITWQQ